MVKRIILIFILFLVLLFTFLILKEYKKEGDSQPVEQTVALEQIKNRPEVKQYISVMAKAGTKAEFNIEDGGSEWRIQVFEIVKQGGENHTATFNWYRVDKKTGAVEKEF